MADPIQPDFKKLKSILLTSAIQQKNNPLYQVINTLLDFLTQLVKGFNGVIGINTTTGGLKNQQYLTWQDNLATLPNSKNLLAGSNITFTDTAGKRTVSSTAGEVSFVRIFLMMGG